MGKQTRAYQTYEQVALHILNELKDRFGAEYFESSRKIKGNRSGRNWDIEGKGVCSEDGVFLIVECRRYTTSRLKAEHIGGIAYRIIDTGARGGIVVSPYPLQKGARKIAEAEKIHSVQLTADSTPEQYIVRLLKELIIRPAPGVAVGSGVDPVVTSRRTQSAISSPTSSSRELKKRAL
jgi:hypothetical protein